MKGARSPSMRREWIEILAKTLQLNGASSPSMRREWIEIIIECFFQKSIVVSLHAEGVD